MVVIHSWGWGGLYRKRDMGQKVVWAKVIIHEGCHLRCCNPFFGGVTIAALKIGSDFVEGCY